MPGTPRRPDEVRGTGPQPFGTPPAPDPAGPVVEPAQPLLSYGNAPGEQTGPFGAVQGDQYGVDQTGPFGAARSGPHATNQGDPYGSTRTGPHGAVQSGPFPMPGEQSGPHAARDTSGVQVRLSTRRRAREERESKGRRNGLIAAGAVAVAAALVTGGLLLLPGSGDKTTGEAPATTRAGGAPSENGRQPRTGRAVEVGTADGSRYRVATVTSGTSSGATQQTGSTSGGKAVYIEYVLSNPTRDKVLLDFPGDVFVRTDLVAAKSRGRCMWQAGVPESMCTPPVKNDVVRTLKGGPLLSGDGTDKYLPPGGAYLVRATVEVPLTKLPRRSELRLYIWKKLYMDDQVAKEAPFPAS